ncbi:MAG: LytTR family DNA-binding domain-containing protein [Gemmatimonadota bacterium]
MIHPSVPLPPIRVVIVDDEPLPRERIRTLLAAHGNITVVAEASDGADAVQVLLAEQPDLIFLDIQMPEFDGFEVLEGLGSTAIPAVIFVTAFDEYAVRAFEVSAIDYLLKPIDPSRFEQALSRALARLVRPGGVDAQSMQEFLGRWRAERGYAARFVVRTGSKIGFIRTLDVDWIDAAGNYVRLHAGGKQHLVRETMKSVESRLDPEAFVRVHRSAIVNIDRVASLEPYFHGEYVVRLKDGTKLTSSRSHSARLRALIRETS